MQGYLKSWLFKRGRINLLTRFLFIAVLIAISPILKAKSQPLEAVSAQSSFFVGEDISSPPVLQKNTFFPVSEPFFAEEANNENNRRLRVIVTAYSSTVWETDDTPYITASGTYVREGIIATNFLPFGTKIKIPEIYEDRVFTVEDRMHHRYQYNVDIWFPDYEEALDFGARRTYIEILEG